jgi:hypothetical protein
MNPDVFGPILNAARLAEYGCRFTAAGGEIEAYCELLEGTSSLLSHTKASRTKLSISLTTETKKHIDGEINRTETALERAWVVVSRSCSGGSKGKRIGWVFKDKDAAQTHKDVLAQRHATLVGISLELAVVSHLRPPYVQQPSSRALDQLATRHTKCGVAEAEGDTWSLGCRKGISPTHNPFPVYAARRFLMRCSCQRAVLLEWAPR